MLLHAVAIVHSTVNRASHGVEGRKEQCDAPVHGGGRGGGGPDGFRAVPGDELAVAHDDGAVHYEALVLRLAFPLHFALKCLLHGRDVGTEVYLSRRAST